MFKLSDDHLDCVKRLATTFKDMQYAIRGTASLVLQKIDMNVDDIDIVCDESTALIANHLLKAYILEPVTYQESPKFKSYFGKFRIHNVDIEFMGNWQIKDKKSEWSQIYDGSSFNEVEVDGIKVRVTKVENELKMFLLMGRFTAFQKIKRQLDTLEKSEVPETPAQPSLF